MSFAWLALADDRLLAAPGDGPEPADGALRMDGRLCDPEGAACEVSLVLTPPGQRVPMDDPAVQQARRAILAGRAFDGVTVLLSDDSRFEGALLIARGDQVARLADDPFARLHPARRLSVPAGVLGSAPMPPGPVIERYGSANPWPWDRF